MEEIARDFSTVVPGDQVDTGLCSRKIEKIFEERKDTTLSGKLVKKPPVRGQFGEGFVELREERKDTTLSGKLVKIPLSVGSSGKPSSSFVQDTRRRSSAPMRTMDRNMRSSEK